jgi:DNA polymerase-3 subunit beta
MKFICLVENIEKHAPLLLKTIPSHPQIQVFSNLLLEAKDNEIFLTATDLDTGVVARVPAKVEERGQTAVPGQRFLEAISSLPKEKVTIQTKDTVLELVFNENRLIFETTNPQEFPTLIKEEKEKGYNFTKEEFKKIVSPVVFCVSQDQARPELTGVLFVFNKNKLTLVATDGYRLSLLETKKQTEKEGKMIIPARLITDALSLKTDISVFLQSEKNQIFFETEDTQIVGRVIAGEFPDYERVIPKESKTKVVFDREELLNSLRLAHVFARDNANIVRFKIKDGQLFITSQARGVGEGKIALAVEQEGEEGEIAFNIKFLFDLLRNIEEKSLVMEINGPLEPAVFRIPQNNEFLHIIMPVRVQE